MNRALAAVLGACALATSASSAAAPKEERPPATSSWSSSRFLQDHFGIEVARGLVRGDDLSMSASEDALRGIDRAISIGTPEGVLLLVKLLGDAHGIARSDTRVMLSATRALFPFASQRAVARALAEGVLNAPSALTPARPTDEEDRPSAAAERDRYARLELARETAALALAQAKDAHATDLLLITARGGGPGQAAARAGLLLFPPVTTTAPLVQTASAVELSVALGDLRGMDIILESTRSLEAPVRAAAFRGVGALGDSRALATAEAGTHDADARVREAATRALVDLGTGDAANAVRRLIEDDATAARGVELSDRVSGEEVVGALAARIRVSSDAPLRAAALAALGRQEDPRALAALRELLTVPVLAGDAAEAIARSDDAEAWQVIAATLGTPPTRRLGARMAALRGLVQGGSPVGVTASLRALARASDGADRAAGIAALVLVGDDLLQAGLADADPRVRRAAAMACEPTDLPCAHALLERLGRETDPATRLLLGRGLACAAAAGSFTTTTLHERARNGDVDAPLAALALARRGEDAERHVVLETLASTDPLLRAHAARGLGQSMGAWASEGLASAYESEADTAVRRALVDALASRTVDGELPSRARALDRAARLDPDPAVHAIAARALRGLPPPTLPSRPSAVWLRVMNAQGKPPSSPPRAILVRADGLALPVVFDDDGYALVPAPRGGARLLLASGLPAYEPLPHAD